MQREDGPVVAQLPSDKMVESMADLAELAEKKRIRDLMENDPIVQSLLKYGDPVTQENYLALAYPGEEMTPELLDSLPEFFTSLPSTSTEPEIMDSSEGLQDWQRRP